MTFDADDQRTSPALTAFVAGLHELTVLHRSSLADTGRVKTDKPNVSAVAKATRLPRGYVQQIYAGTKTISRGDLTRILDALKVTEEERKDIETIYTKVMGETDALDRTGVHARPGQYLSDGFIPINTWSLDRMLNRENLDLHFTNWHPQNATTQWPEWNSLRERFVSDGAIGRVGSVQRIQAIDYREEEGQSRFALDVARIDYATQLATRSLLARRPELRKELEDTLLDDGYEAFLAQIPPSAVAANINVVSRDGMVLLCQRSPAVKTYASQWNVGINETMNYREVGEDFIDLTLRGLREEVGLTPEMLKSAVISWFGYCFDCANFYIFAHARSTLDAREITEHAQHSESAFEATERHWVPFESEPLQATVDKGPAPDGSKRWLHHAGVSAVELWKSRAMLTRDNVINGVVT